MSYKIVLLDMNKQNNIKYYVLYNKYYTSCLSDAIWNAKYWNIQQRQDAPNLQIYHLNAIKTTKRSRMLMFLQNGMSIEEIVEALNTYHEYYKAECKNTRHESSDTLECIVKFNIKNDIKSAVDKFQKTTSKTATVQDLFTDDVFLAQFHM